MQAIQNIQMEKIIYDIGMHAGRDTEFYLKKGFKVVAIEANPALVEKATIKFKDDISTGRLIIIDKAIAPAGVDTIEFYTNDKHDDWGTIIPDWNRGQDAGFKSITVQTVPLQTIIQTHGVPYYMKIDIEGADMLCLQALKQMNVVPEYLSIELLTPNNYKNKNVDCLEILFYLYAMGYRKFKVSDQTALGSIKLPNPAREGNYADFNFSGGFVSGPFGKELEGPVYTIDQISKKYLDYFYSSPGLIKSMLVKIFRKAGISVVKKGDFHSNGWFDVHAYK